MSVFSLTPVHAFAWSEHTIKRMFHQGPGPGLRALILVFLSIVLIFFDQRSVVFHSFCNRVSSVFIYPFQWMVDAPTRSIDWLGENMASRHHLLDENAKLRLREILLQSQLQSFLALEKENAELRQLLQSTSKVPGKVSIARLLAVSLDPNLQELVLDRGAAANVYKGQPVLDAFGVMGQVITVGPLTSKIRLITDKQSAVPVEDYRTGMRAIAVGMGGSGTLSLENVPDKNDIQLGDLFVTSGLGLCYPVGYPVGVVRKIEHVKNNLEANIILSPSAHLDKTELVLLAWPDKTVLSKAIEQELNATPEVDLKNKKEVGAQ